MCLPPRVAFPQLPFRSALYCVAVQAEHSLYGEVYTELMSGAQYTRFSSLKKYPSKGQHPLPQIAKLSSVLFAMATHDEAHRQLQTRMRDFGKSEVPECTHPNTFSFPEQGPVFMDTLKQRTILRYAPSFLLCSDCGVCLAQSGDRHAVHPNLSST